MWFPPKDDSYTPADDGPEARMHREAAEQHAKDCAMVDKLLASLRPWHATEALISFANRIRYGIKRPRARPVD